MVWCGMVRYGMVCMVRYGMVRCNCYCNAFRVSSIYGNGASNGTDPTLLSLTSIEIVHRDNNGACDPKHIFQ